jgi:heme/copper-type cytochrome/quinol oxidase subunit 2
MKCLTKLKYALLPAVTVALLHADSAHACAACFGKSDSPLAEGMNWGIFSLIGVVVCVLGGIASVGIFFVRRSAALAAAAAPQPTVSSLPAGELLATQKA